MQQVLLHRPLTQKLHQSPRAGRVLLSPPVIAPVAVTVATGNAPTTMASVAVPAAVAAVGCTASAGAHAPVETAFSNAADELLLVATATAISLTAGAVIFSSSIGGRRRPSLFRTSPVPGVYQCDDSAHRRAVADEDYSVRSEAPNAHSVMNVKVRQQGWPTGSQRGTTVEACGMNTAGITKERVPGPPPPTRTPELQEAQSSRIRLSRLPPTATSTHQRGRAGTQRRDETQLPLARLPDPLPTARRFHCSSVCTMS